MILDMFFQVLMGIELSDLFLPIAKQAFHFLGLDLLQNGSGRLGLDGRAYP